jgi:hypothetical protein
MALVAGYHLQQQRQGQRPDAQIYPTLALSAAAQASCRNGIKTWCLHTVSACMWLCVHERCRNSGGKSMHKACDVGQLY